VAGATYIRLSLRAPERAYEEAQEAYKARDFPKAVQLLEDWASIDRDTFKQATVLYQLGITHTELKNPAAAITTHERLRFQFPNVDYHAGTLFHLARNYAALGSKAEARDYAEKLEKDYKDSSWARRLRAEVPDIFSAPTTP
jgi:TolA-binding protein